MRDHGRLSGNTWENPNMCGACAEIEFEAEHQEEVLPSQGQVLEEVADSLIPSEPKHVPLFHKVA